MDFFFLDFFFPFLLHKKNLEKNPEQNPKKNLKKIRIFFRIFLDGRTLYILKKKNKLSGIMCVVLKSQTADLSL